MRAIWLLAALCLASCAQSPGPSGGTNASALCINPSTAARKIACGVEGYNQQRADELVSQYTNQVSFDFETGDLNLPLIPERSPLNEFVVCNVGTDRAGRISGDADGQSIDITIPPRTCTTPRYAKQLWARDASQPDRPMEQSWSGVLLSKLSNGAG